MLLSTTINPINNYYSNEKCIQIIKKAGFDAYDMPISSLINIQSNNTIEEQFIESAFELRRYADKIGILCNQAHASCPSSSENPEDNNKLLKNIILSIELSSILGAKTLIVHPKQHLKYSENIETLFHLNMTFYNHLIPYCKKFGVKIAIENMWQYDAETNSITHSTCSRSYEFKKYLDTINSEWIVGCLDIGHAALLNSNVADFIYDLGKTRIAALHIHDNSKKQDDHTLPFNGVIDFPSITKALGEIDYQGDFTFEAYRYFINKPLELIPSAYKYANSIGRYLINEIVKFKK